MVVWMIQVTLWSSACSPLMFRELAGFRLTPRSSGLYKVTPHLRDNLNIRQHQTLSRLVSTCWHLMDQILIACSDATTPYRSVVAQKYHVRCFDLGNYVPKLLCGHPRLVERNKHRLLASGRISSELPRRDLDSEYYV